MGCKEEEDAFDEARASSLSAEANSAAVSTAVAEAASTTAVT